MSLIWTFANLLGDNLPEAAGWTMVGDQDAAAVFVPYYYRQPDATSRYFRPGGVDFYLRP